VQTGRISPGAHGSGICSPEYARLPLFESVLSNSIHDPPVKEIERACLSFRHSLWELSKTWQMSVCMSRTANVCVRACRFCCLRCSRSFKLRISVSCYHIVICYNVIVNTA
jgi:hypothetical protein